MCTRASKSLEIATGLAKDQHGLCSPAPNPVNPLYPPPAFLPCSIGPVFPASPQPPSRAAAGAPTAPAPSWSPRATKAGWGRTGSYQPQDEGSDRRPLLLIINSWCRFSCYFVTLPPSQCHLQRPSTFSSAVSTC